MEVNNQEPEYIARVDSAVEAMHCPECGQRAALMAVVWNPYAGVYTVAPVFSCDTPDCEFSVEAEAAWTPVSID